MKNLKHITEQPFVFATGLAALIHSTWALGTLFSGQAPVVDWQSWEWYEWIVPALLISFAMDVGQISTSGQIRDNGLTWARGFTFLIFAIATYYLQWLYMAVHMPLLDISAGVTGGHTAIAENMRNWAIWLVPALLPISTVSYTFSGNKQKAKQDDYVDFENVPINIYSMDNHQDALPFADGEINLLPDAGHVAECDACGWTRDGYDSDLNARRALSMHQRSCDGAESQTVNRVSEETHLEVNHD